MELPNEEHPLVLRKSETEELRLYTSTYKNRTRLHIRKFWLDTKEDKMKPSREGIALNAAEIAQVLEALQAVVQANIVDP